MLRLAAGLLLSAAASELELTSNIFTIYFKFTSSLLKYVSNTSEIYFKYLKKVSIKKTKLCASKWQYA